MLKRLTLFLRSVIPADPWQLLFLVGTIFLLIAPRVSWRIDWITVADGFMRGTSPISFYDDIYPFVVLGTFLILIGGVSALYSSFWAVQKPPWVILWGVMLPSSLGLCIIFFKFFPLLQGYQSALLSFDRRFLQIFHWIKLHGLEFPVGFHIIALASLAITVYTVRIVIGATSLTRSVPLPVFPREPTSESWPRLKLLVFVFIGFFALLATMSAQLILTLSSIVPSTLVKSLVGFLLLGLFGFVDAVILLAISLSILGPPGRSAARSSLHWPSLRFLSLAFAIPVFFNFVVPLFHYIFDRAQWAAMDFGKFDAPRFLPYFYAGVSPVALLTALSMFFPVLAEEVVFRGMVLPDFLQRYGLHRGIFLTGIFWAAIHFRSDSYVRLSVGGVLRVLIWRILFCLTLNYVFAWMTLRCHSVLPAAIAHFMSNALVSLGPRVGGLWDGELYLALWVLLAMLLYRVWPLETDNPPILLLPDQEPELAL